MAALGKDAASKIGSEPTSPNPSAETGLDNGKVENAGSAGTGGNGGGEGAAESADAATSAPGGIITVVGASESGGPGSVENSAQFTSENTQQSSAGNADSSIPKQSNVSFANQNTHASAETNFSTSTLDVTTITPASNVTDTQQNSTKGMGNTIASAVCMKNNGN